MSEKNHYETLGLDENSSFEEIQDARNRLLKKHSGDRKQAEAIEMAYDAILMDRLRLRQEGKIKVPDRIRFPERPKEMLPQSLSKPTPQAPNWLQQFLDNPSQNEILWPAIAFSGVAILGLLDNPEPGQMSSLPAIALSLGVIFCIYFLSRKENKFFRSLGLTFGGLVVGVVFGRLLSDLVVGPVSNLGLGQITSQGFEVFTTAFLLWLISSFLR